MITQNTLHNRIYTLLQNLPWSTCSYEVMVDVIGESTLRQVCEEILALSKLNFNNCNYYSSLPITLTFSQKVGEVIQYIPEDIEPPNRYYYYM